MAKHGPDQIWRDGDRIASHDSGGYSDRVSDETIRGHIGHAGPEGPAADAFCEAVLAIRKYERLSAKARDGWAARGLT